MKKLMCEPIEDKSKIAKAHSRGRVQLAKMVEAKSSDLKLALQKSFLRISRQSSSLSAVCQAKLISKVNPSEFRIVRMPG